MNAENKKEIEISFSPEPGVDFEVKKYIQTKSGKREGNTYVRTREVILRNVATASGKALMLSDNPFMFEDVKVDTN